MIAALSCFYKDLSFGEGIENDWLEIKKEMEKNKFRNSRNSASAYISLTS